MRHPKLHHWLCLRARSLEVRASSLALLVGLAFSWPASRLSAQQAPYWGEVPGCEDAMLIEVDHAIELERQGGHTSPSRLDLDCTGARLQVTLRDADGQVIRTRRIDVADVPRSARGRIVAIVVTEMLRRHEEARARARARLEAERRRTAPPRESSAASPVLQASPAPEAPVRAELPTRPDTAPGALIAPPPLEGAPPSEAAPSTAAPRTSDAAPATGESAPVSSAVVEGAAPSASDAEALPSRGVGTVEDARPSSSVDPPQAPDGAAVLREVSARGTLAGIQLDPVSLREREWALVAQAGLRLFTASPYAFAVMSLGAAFGAVELGVTGMLTSLEDAAGSLILYSLAGHVALALLDLRASDFAVGFGSTLRLGVLGTRGSAGASEDWLVEGALSASLAVPVDDSVTFEWCVDAGATYGATFTVDGAARAVVDGLFVESRLGLRWWP